MDNNNQSAPEYGKKLGWWNWVLIYAVVAAVAYGAVYYFYLKPKNAVAPYGTNATQAQPSAQTPSGSAEIPGAASVAIHNFKFAPTPLAVKKGATVTWINFDSSTHTVTGNIEGFASPDLRNGASYSYTFTQVGTYSYHCSFHPSMTGIVQVVE